MVPLTSPIKSMISCGSQTKVRQLDAFALIAPDGVRLTWSADRALEEDAPGKAVLVAAAELQFE